MRGRGGWGQSRGWESIVCGSAGAGILQEEQRSDKTRADKCATCAMRASQDAVVGAWVSQAQRAFPAVSLGNEARFFFCRMIRERRGEGEAGGCRDRGGVGKGRGGGLQPAHLFSLGDGMAPGGAILQPMGLEPIHNGPLRLPPPSLQRRAESLAGPPVRKKRLFSRQRSIRKGRLEMRVQATRKCMPPEM